MVGRRITELACAPAGLPAAAAQRLRVGDAKPMELIGRLVSQPFQPLPLFAHRLLRAFKGRHQPHVLLEPGHHRDLPALAQVRLGVRRDIAHVRHDQVGIPLPAPVTVNHAGLEKPALAIIGGGHPTDQRHQQDAPLIMGHPEPQRVLLIPDEAPALAAFERPAT